jgi:hypothetical protein
VDENAGRISGGGVAAHHDSDVAARLCPLSPESDDTEEASPVTAGAGPSPHRGCSQPLFPVHRFWYGWKM